MKNCNKCKISEDMALCELKKYVKRVFSGEIKVKFTQFVKGLSFIHESSLEIDGISFKVVLLITGFDFFDLGNSCKKNTSNVYGIGVSITRSDILLDNYFSMGYDFWETFTKKQIENLLGIYKDRELSDADKKTVFLFEDKDGFEGVLCEIKDHVKEIVTGHNKENMKYYPTIKIWSYNEDFSTSCLKLLGRNYEIGIDISSCDVEKNIYRMVVSLSEIEKKEFNRSMNYAFKVKLNKKEVNYLESVKGNKNG